MVYIMNEERRAYGTPSSDYYQTILEGYLDAGFDIGILNSAVAVSRMAANRSIY